MQTLSGTGAVRMIAEFLHAFHPVKVVYFSSPTWGRGAYGAYGNFLFFVAKVTIITYLKRRVTAAIANVGIATIAKKREHSISLA